MNSIALSRTISNACSERKRPQYYFFTRNFVYTGIQFCVLALLFCREHSYTATLHSYIFTLTHVCSPGWQVAIKMFLSCLSPDHGYLFKGTESQDFVKKLLLQLGGVRLYFCSNISKIIGQLLAGPEELIWWKYLQSKVLWHCPFNMQINRCRVIRIMLRIFKNGD